MRVDEEREERVMNEGGDERRVDKEKGRKENG